MSQEERALDNIGRGNIKPTIELREALEEINKCRSFFAQGGFIEYLHSVNQYYLENQGKVTDPEPVIYDKVGSDYGEGSEILELSNEFAAGALYI